MPLGLHHLIGGDHYEPMPENPDPRRADWSAIYYHRASRDAIGFDRSPRGSNAVGQYRSPLREQWADPATTPERLLLWFHRLPWGYRLSSGRTLWEGLVHHYTRGAVGARVDGLALGAVAWTRRFRPSRGGAGEAAAPGRRRRGLARQVPEVLPAVQRRTDPDRRTSGRPLALNTVHLTSGASR